MLSTFVAAMEKYSSVTVKASDIQDEENAPPAKVGLPPPLLYLASLMIRMLLLSISGQFGFGVLLYRVSEPIRRLKCRQFELTELVFRFST